MRRNVSNQLRLIIQIITPQPVIEGAGVRLKRSFPGQALDYPDPFLLFDHFGSDDPNDYLAGFPMHPHRGIETVTYMLSGVVAHRDSIGNAGTIGAGDAQWMTAGRGILHEEMPQRAQDRLDGFQLWVNLPAKSKMIPPRYQDISAASIPTVTRDAGIAIRVIAGQVDGVRGPVTDIIADPTYLDVSVPAHATFTHAIESGHTVIAYVFEGAGAFGASRETMGAPRLIVFGDGDAIQVRAEKSGVRFLLMSGKPSYEPIARYGPFVMNTREEILQTLRELEDGTFARE
ncbi:MAG: pirin family protein [Chloroflexi bacterium]|nr:pirin family protein [Chloroflexota bacterium]